MTLPQAEQAVVDIEKIRDYCLNPAHPRGRYNARVFASALGLLLRDAEWLRAQLLNAALQNEATVIAEDQYGIRYVVDFECVRKGNLATIRSGWIVRQSEHFARLTSC